MKYIRSWRLWALLHFVYHRPHGDRLPSPPTFHVANVPCEDSFKIEHVVPPCIPACSKFTFSRFQLLFVQHTSKPTPRKCHEGCLVSQNLTLNTKYVECCQVIGSQEASYLWCTICCGASLAVCFYAVSCSKSTPSAMAPFHRSIPRTPQRHKRSRNLCTGMRNLIDPGFGASLDGRAFSVLWWRSRKTKSS